MSQPKVPSIILTILMLNCLGCAHARASAPFVSCYEHPDQYPERSAELQSIVNADQADRQGSYDKIDWSKVLPRDLERRVRVGEIFAEGCFKDAKDYAAAAMVYQHGETPDHFYQTFIWAKKAVDLGDPAQKWLMAAGLDRYLVRSGQKELFATQYSRDAGSPCWCLEPVETTFPEAKRIEYAKLSLEQALARLNSMNEGLGSCTEVQQVLQATRLKNGSRILDLACGVGRHSVEFARQGMRVTGLDYSLDYVSEARANVKKASLQKRIKIIRGDKPT